ncbi:DUF6443 domain-containing protein [Chryseobacterium sp. R2ACT005]|uniref:DUF6443 domain-containing protein n=1 Tax=Chryseobacterium sp. R2ACT005 TaxID=3416668 RepID=UPI003CED0FE4
MKKLIIPIGALLLSNLIYAQLTPLPNTENYIQTKTYLDYNGTSATKSSETVQYFDGLGRSKQIVNVKASPLGRDIVTPIKYDQFGRQVQDYLPIPQAGTLNGAITPDPLSNVGSTPYGLEKIYSQKILENSPLDRVLGQKQVGTAWDNKPVQFGYAVNADGDVKKYTATFNYTTFTSSLTLSGSYGTGQLYKNTVTDEDGNQTIEFKNGKGQLLLVRKVIGATENADTYYVYNDYDQLAFVIPPKASVATDPNTVLNDLCYQYKYDGRNRLVEKKIPGKGWEFMIYDKQDRLVGTQDAELRAKRQWLYTKYDQFGRVAVTGLATGGERNAEQQLANDSGNMLRTTSSVFNRQGMDVFYDPAISYPHASKWVALLSVNYYDSYPAYSFNPAFPSAIQGEPVLSGLPTADGRSTKGLPVMSFVKNIEDDNWTKNYTYYDTKGRAIGSHSINHLGGYTKTESQLDFTGTPKQTKTFHKRLNADTEKVITETFEYDNGNRLLVHKHQIDSYPVEILAQNEYNELSQLKNKKVGNNLQSIDYTYNIRGWLTKINDPAALNGKLFGYEIKYNNPTYGTLASGKYNGNIAEIDWISSGDGILRRYSYQYDTLNRLKNGIYSEPNASIPQNNYYNESLSYDLNGNITSLQRNRNAANIEVQLMDNLSYSYTGNRLDTVTDSSGNYFGYPDTSGNPMHYDTNGNMTDHVDKGMLQIDYNYLNLPNYIKFSQYVVSRKGQISYVNTNYIYRADGTKLHKKYNYFTPRTNVGAVTLNDYLDGFQYTNTDSVVQPDGNFTMALQFFPTAEGYYDFVTNKYIYQYKDQVGNIRLAFFKDSSGNVAIDRTTDYYPFGLEFGGDLNISGSMSPNYTYTSQGQEKQLETGWISYRWRNYDPAMGRFFSIDPLAEKFTHNSTYAFQENMIGMGIELEGLELLKNNSGYFAIRGNEMIVKQAPASQRDSFGRPSFSAADIGLSTNGYNPTVPRISSSETGLKLNSYNYNGTKPEGATMESAESESMGEQKVKTTDSNKLAEAKEKLATVADGVKELMNNAFMAMDIPSAIKSTDNYVQAAKDIKSVEFNATQMDLAIDYVNSSKIKMNQQTKNDVINYVYDGTLPNKGLMQNSSIIQNGNSILRANYAPIRPTAEQVKNMLNNKQKQIENNLKNIPQ